MIFILRFLSRRWSTLNRKTMQMMADRRIGERRSKRTYVITKASLRGTVEPKGDGDMYFERLVGASVSGCRSVARGKDSKERAGMRGTKAYQKAERKLKGSLRVMPARCVHPTAFAWQPPSNAIGFLPFGKVGVTQ
jgi:hypothetical protein